MVSIINMFFRRIIKDFQQKELIPLKFIFFIHASTVLVLYPYLTIHMRELGINVKETAIMSAVIPFIAIIMPPLAGMLADKIGNFRVLLAFFSTLVGPVALLLLLVPVGRLTITYPDDLIMDLSCNENNNLVLSTDERNYSCHSLPAHQERSQQINVQLKSCGLACPVTNEAVTETSLLQIYQIEIYANETSTVVQYNPKLSALNEVPMNQSRFARKLKNNIYFKDSVRIIGNKLVFFPLDQQSFVCQYPSAVRNDTKCSLSSNATNPLNSFYVDVLGKNIISEEEETFMIKQFQFLSFSKDEWSVKRFPVCDNQEQSKSIISATSVNTSQILFINCKPHCLLSTKRKNLCENLKIEKELNIQLTFWAYLCTRVLIGIIGGTAFAMFEGAVIAVLREHKADYGLQRVYATIGGMISSPLSGMLIDWASEGKDYTDFRPAFWLYAFLKITTGFLILLVRLDFKKPAEDVVGDMKIVLRNPEMIALLIACFVLGTAWGYIESFLFWLLQDLGGSRSLMGITITVGGIFGIPLLVMSGPLINKIGHANVLFIGFVFYAVRLLGYSLIYNAWYCLIFEAMESVTTGLAFTAAVTYAAKLSTTTTDTSIQGLLGGLYFGVGKGSGSLIGGFMISAIGARETYQVFSGIMAITGIVYFLFNHFYLRKHATEGNDICKKEKPIDEKKEKSTEKNKMDANYKETKLNTNDKEVKSTEKDLKLKTISEQPTLPDLKLNSTPNDTNSRPDSADKDIEMNLENSKTNSSDKKSIDVNIGDASVAATNETSELSSNAKVNLAFESNEKTDELHKKKDNLDNSQMYNVNLGYENDEEEKEIKNK